MLNFGRVLFHFLEPLFCGRSCLTPKPPNAKHQTPVNLVRVQLGWWEKGAPFTTRNRSHNPQLAPSREMCVLGLTGKRQFLITLNEFVAISVHIFQNGVFFLYRRRGRLPSRLPGTGAGELSIIAFRTNPKNKQLRCGRGFWWHAIR